MWIGFVAAAFVATRRLDTITWGWYVAAAARHYEIASSGGDKGLAQGWNEGIDDEDMTYTRQLYSYALDWAELPTSDQHPWEYGYSLDLAAARWEGIGTGGSQAVWNSGVFAGWNHAPSDATATIEFTEAGRVHINGTATAGWLCVDGAYSGSDAYVDFAPHPAAKLLMSSLVVGDDEYGRMSMSGGTAYIGDRMTVGKKSGGQGWFSLTGATDGLIPRELTVGMAGTGTFSHTGGLLLVGDIIGEDTRGSIFLGRDVGGAGLYNQNGSTAEIDADQLHVGYRGTGALNLQNGTIGLEGDMTVAYKTGSAGTYTQSAGALSGFRLTVGGRGVGSFIVNGGTATFTDNVIVGSQDNGGGLVEIGSAGQLHADNMYVGWYAAGEVRQTGVVDLDGELIVGANAGAVGAYILNAGSLSPTRLEVGDAGTGTFTQNSGTVETGFVYVGKSSGSDGLYHMQAGTLQVGAGKIELGMGGSGELRSSGGTVIADELTIGSDGLATVGTSTAGVVLVNQLAISNTAPQTFGELQIGHGEGLGFGLSSLGDDADVQVQDGMTIGQSGSGRSFFAHSGRDSSLSVTGDLYIGQYAAATYTLTGDNAVLSARDIYVGHGADGAFSQSAGLIEAEQIILGLNDVDAQYNLSGGTVNAETFAIGWGSAGTLTFSGGRLDGNIMVYADGLIDVVDAVAVRGQLNLQGGTVDAAGQGMYFECRGEDRTSTISAGQLTADFLVVRSGYHNEVGIVQSGGTVTLNELRLSNNSDNIFYTVQGGALDVSSGEIAVLGSVTAPGQNNGIFQVDGGSVVAEKLTIGSRGVVRGDGTVTINQLIVERDSTTIFPHVQVGHAAGTGGGLVVLGEQKDVTFAKDLDLGHAGDTTFRQDDSSQVTVIGALNIATGENHQATYYLNGSGTELQAENIYLAGDGSGTGGTGTLRIGAGKANFSGRVLIRDNGTVELNGGELSADRVQVLSGGQFLFQGGTLATESFVGDLNNPQGTLAPGRSPGVMTVSGDVNQGNNATLQIELAGTVRGSWYDAIDVNGALSLDGDLDVLLLGGYMPAADTTFDILDWYSLTGQFDNVNLPTLTGGLGWDVSSLYDDGSLLVYSTTTGQREWTGLAGNGQFADADNWSPTSVPGVGQQARFALDQTHTVTLAQDTANDRLTVDTEDDKTLTLRGTTGGLTYTLAGNETGTAVTVGGGAMRIENLHVEAEGKALIGTSPVDAKLTITDGARFSCGYLQLGGGSGSAELVVLDGGVLAADEIRISDETLTTHAGSEVRVNRLTGTFGPFLGSLAIGHPGGTGDVTMHADDTLDVHQDLTVGLGATGRLQARGGQVLVGQDLRIGALAGSSGELAVLLGSSNARMVVAGASYVGQSGQGALSVTSGGEARFNGSVQVGANASADGAVTVSGSGSTATFQSHLNLGGTAVASGGSGSLTIDHGGSTTVDGTLKVWSGGTVDLRSGSLRAGTVDHTHGGAFGLNGGTFSAETFTGNLLNAAGTVTPGQSPRTMTVTGNYNQQADGTLAIELGGTLAGLFDVLNVSGTMSLGGKLSVDWYDGFVAAEHDSFDILNWGSLIGQFDTLALPGLNGNLFWDTSNLYTSGTLAIHTEPVYVYDWVGPSGQFGQASNWSPSAPAGPPVEVNRAEFKLQNQSYAVQFADDHTNELAYVKSSTGETVTFQGTASGKTYALTRLGSTSPSLNLAEGNLWIENLHVDAAGLVRVGSTLNNAKLTLAADGQLSADEVTLKNNVSTLEVLSGGTLTADKLRGSSTATIFTTADGSTVRVNSLIGFVELPTFNGHLAIGHAGPTAADWKIDSNETLNVGGNLTVGYDTAASLEHDGDVNVGGTLYLGETAAGSGYYVLDNGTLTAAQVVVGYLGGGIFEQAGGDVSASVSNGDTYVYRFGDFTGGFYNEGILDIRGQMRVDGWLQTNTDLTVTDWTSLRVTGTFSAVSGTTTLGQYSTLESQDAYIGGNGDATLRQVAGIHAVAGLLTVGSDFGGEARYELLGGTASAENLQIGSQFGDGVVAQSGGRLTVTDTLTVGAGTGDVAGRFELTDGQLTADTIVVNVDGTFTLDGGELSVANFVGDLLCTSGRVAPGQSPGRMVVDGDFEQGSYGILEIELFGLDRYNEYDVLEVTDTLTLGGELAVVLGFEPQDGDTFDILDWGNLSGQFDSLDLPHFMDPALQWDTSMLYTDGTLGVVPEPASLALLAMGGLAILKHRN